MHCTFITLCSALIKASTDLRRTQGGEWADAHGLGWGWCFTAIKLTAAGKQASRSRQAGFQFCLRHQGRTCYTGGAAKCGSGGGRGAVQGSFFMWRLRRGLQATELVVGLYLSVVWGCIQSVLESVASNVTGSLGGA